MHLYYDDFEVGQTFPIFEYSISAEDMAVHRASYQCSLTAVENAESDSLTDVISPFAINSFLAMRASMSMPDGVLHARETLRLHAPAYLSDRLQVQLSVVEKYERNGRPFVVFRHSVTREEGEAVMDIDRTICWVRKGASS